jgi:hypothetical protein
MLDAARLVLGKGHDMCDADCDSRHVFFAPTLAPIATLCEAFPLLADAVLNLFLKLKLALRSEISSKGPLASGRPRELSREVSVAVDKVTAIVLMNGAL